MGRPDFRWRLAEDGQDALFERQRRVVGRGEYRSLTFWEVEARSIINPVPVAARLPFRHTINPYRGCSHACVYCLAGDTPILMGDGRRRPLADIRPGDIVYGTVRDGSYRRYVLTKVLAHWKTVKPAHRVTLADGTELTASGDHRFLTDRGWRFVGGGRDARGERPRLTTSDRLLGPGSPMVSVPFERRTDLHRGMTATVDVEVGVSQEVSRLAGSVVESTASSAVRRIEPLDTDSEMFDITTGTGDFVANGVISHNCFARPTHEYLGFGIGEDFDTQIVVKVNAVEVLRAETQPARWAGETIAMGTNTDPYQKAEGRYRLTQGIVETLIERANPFSVLTKSTLALRDLELYVTAARSLDVSVNFSIPTLDEDVWRATEPHTPNPRHRMEAVRRFNEAGVPSGVMVAPLLPGISDAAAQVERVTAAAREAGARYVTPMLLHLKPGVKEHYMAWLADHHPDLVDRYAEMYRGRAYLPDQRRSSRRPPAPGARKASQAEQLRLL